MIFSEPLFTNNIIDDILWTMRTKKNLRKNTFTVIFHSLVMMFLSSRKAGISEAVLLFHLFSIKYELINIKH